MQQIELDELDNEVAMISRKSPKNSNIKKEEVKQPFKLLEQKLD